ncbi:Kae1-associated serine/threonine protein kinase [Candidatus Bathyarchaeota archaeon]|nr:Kae1-associated serine/threonine protein kinase [Candidatus Bathyarchaeota archaeon]MBS7627837.1 Kae1-associated serine/threonine protein kinase [Candidatus Bathyarchaeota archaeon]
MKLIYKGAEADVYESTWHGYHVIVKKRVPKAYRIDILDQELRKRRTIFEAQLLMDVKRIGVPAPTVMMLDPYEALLVMTFVEGRRLREKLEEVDEPEAIALCHRLGETVARLHEVGIQHGDLTTSNMILASDGRIFLIDFGLGSYDSDSEALGVDVLLVKRALMSAHYRKARRAFEAFLDGYEGRLGQERAKEVVAKVKEIEERGRYVDRTSQRRMKLKVTPSGK